VLLVIGLLLIGGAWFVRSSPWLHETVLRSKELPELERLVREHPNDAVARYYLGRRYLQSRRFAEAASAYDAAARLDPNSARVRLELGYALYAQGDLKLASTEFLQAKRLDGRSARAEYMLGKVSWAEHNLNEALSHFQHATELDTRLDDAWYGMGLCLISSLHLDAASGAVQKAIAINPNRPDYLATLGELELRLSDNAADARRQFERALQLDPNYGQACALMGELLLQHYSDNATSALAQAEALLVKATGLPTNRPQDVYRDLGQVYILQRQFRKAVSPLQMSIKLDPGDERAYFALVKAYRGLGDTKAVDATQTRFHAMSESQIEKNSLETHLRVQPNDAAAHLKLSRIYLDLGKIAAATLHYKLYLDLHPTSHDAELEQRLRDLTAADAARLHHDLGFPALQ
jgi:tetratricopeptide (TPR) repeat protein